jgi:pyridoxamine 5'-phosphate oxidase
MSDNTKNTPGRHGMDVAALRRSATGFALDREDLDDNPVVQFEDWFRYACETVPLDPNAVTLSTVDSKNRPSSRTVLLKWFDDDGFVFFTNYDSRKAVHIETNPNVSLLFFWSEAARQVKIRGTAENSLLENKFQEIKQKFKNKEVPLPSFWGGYRVIPNEIEFWQGRRNRLHDRFQYTKQDDGSWTIERLAP